MEKIYNSEAFYYVALIGFIAYAAYYLYGIIKYFLKAQQKWNEYSHQYADSNLQKINQYHWWLALLLAFVAYCFFAFFQQSFSSAVLYFHPSMMIHF